MMVHGRIGTGAWLWPVMALMLLGGMLAEARTRLKPADAEKHHIACQNAIDAIPRTIAAPDGLWTGTDAKVPDAAVALLGNPAILCREYVREGSDQSAQLLIVDCRDARDLQGHYPPHCYPAQGRALIDFNSAAGQQGEPRVWHLHGMDITGIEYHFAPSSETDSEKVVYNFFVLPYVPGATVSHKELDGVICSDIDSVYKSGEDYQRRYFGAAEFQLITGSQMSREQRDQAFADLLGPNENVIRLLENRDPGGNKSHD